MNVNVQFFSLLRDLTGVPKLATEVQAGATVADLLAHLYRQYPELAAWEGRMRVAIGYEYAEKTDPLREGDLVSVMPPVQGG